MPELDYTPPKYARIVGALRERIADGTYPPGSMLPSETQLVKEFGVSRPTVVRALERLQLAGEIEREHGRGSFVKARPPISEPEQVRPIRSLMDRAEAEEPGEITSVEQRPAPADIARLLEVAEGAPLILRERVVFQDDTPCELISLWLTPELAHAAGLDNRTALTASVRQLVQSATGRRFGHVAERLTARRPTSVEVKTLRLAKNAPVLGVLATVADTQGRPVLVVDLALPGELHELADVYAL